MRAHTRAWILDVVVGGFAGGMCGAILAVNVMILSGVEGGYEATLVEVYRHNALIGVVVALILTASPVLGVVFARRRRARLRATPSPRDRHQPIA